MENLYIELRDEVPELKSKKCKLIALIIEKFLAYSIYFTTLLSWYIYDYFIAFFTLILSFIIIGIIRSKIRNIAIPSKQKEYQYSDEDISKFYVHHEICYNNKNTLWELTN